MIRTWDFAANTQGTIATVRSRLPSGVGEVFSTVILHANIDSEVHGGITGLTAARRTQIHAQMLTRALVFKR